MFDLDKTK